MFRIFLRYRNMINTKLFILVVLLSSVFHCKPFGVNSSEIINECVDDNGKETTTTKDPSWYRLPEYVIPVSYELWILPELAVNNFMYQGHVKIHLQVLNKTDSLIVHVKGLDVDEEKSKLVAISNDDEIVMDNIIINQQLDTERQWYILSFETNILPGNYSLSLSFTGQVIDQTLGFYRSSHIVNGKTRWLGFTQFSTTYARWAFPCLDEPWLKATYTIHLGHYSNETVTGNTVAENTKEIKPGYFLTTLRKTPRMSTYIVGWAIHDFKYNNNHGNLTAKKFGLWTRENMKDHTFQALNEGWKIYEALTNWINFENPINKMDQIAVPDFYYSAMENWGMVTFRESMVLWKSQSTPSKSIHDAMSTIGHEYAHTWFGNIVTPKFWNVAWLKEGFATFFGHYGQSLVRVNNSNIMDLFAVEVLQSALLDDSMDHNRTMNGQCIGSPQTIRTSMDFVAYKKGASIIRMIKYMIGDWAFQRGLQSYVNTLKYSFATPQDVYQHIEKFTDQTNVLQKSIDMSQVIESWANQPGYPVVTVIRNYTTNLTKLSQERFRLKSWNSKDNVELDNSRWWIPINFAAVESGTATVELNPRAWIRPQPKSIYIKTINSTDTLLCNVDQVYYYRVNYDEVNWQRLINHINSKSFNTIGEPSRASLIDDSFNLARGGYISYSIPLNLSRYLTQDNDYGPWFAATNNFKFLNIMLTAVPNVHHAFETFVNHLTEPIYQHMNLNKFSSNGFRSKLLRDLILSTLCSVNNINCTNTANIAFKQWLGLNKTIDPDEKRAIYATGIRLGNNDDWHKVLKIFLETELHTEKELLIAGLGCTNDYILINKLLNYSLYEGPEVPKQYKLGIFNAVLAGNPSNVDVVLDFVGENLTKIKQIKEPSVVEKIFDAVKKQIVHKEQLQKLKLFVDSNIESLGSSINSARNAVKFAEQNIDWIKSYVPSIAKWLHEANFLSIL